MLTSSASAIWYCDNNLFGLGDLKIGFETFWINIEKYVRQWSFWGGGGLKTSPRSDFENYR